MTVRQQLRLAPLWWAGGWLLASLVVVGSLLPSERLPSFGGMDKLHHFLAYWLMALWFSGMTERDRYLLIALWLLILGACVELAQYAMGFGRSADWRDFVANGLGVAAGLSLAYAGLGSWMLRIERRLGIS